MMITFIEKFEYRFYLFLKSHLYPNTYSSIRRTYSQEKLQHLEVNWPKVKAKIFEEERKILVIYKNDANHTLGEHTKAFEDDIESALGYLKLVLDAVDDYKNRQEFELMNFLSTFFKNQEFTLEAGRNHTGIEEKDYFTVIDLYFKQKSAITFTISSTQIEVSVIENVDDYYFSTPPIDYSSSNIIEVVSFMRHHPLLKGLLKIE